MRASSLAFATILLGFSHAQSNIPGLPECAGGCIGNFGGCGALDANCICNNQQLIANLACCVSVTCNEGDQETTLQFAEGICASYDANLPQSATCAPGAQSTPVSGSATAAPSSASTSGSSSAATTTTGGSGSESSSASSSSASAADGSSASASASASSTPNAGASNGRMESGLGLGLAVAGLIAAI